jgi:cysteine desulfurase family protein (TIGR01976 family)
MPVMSFDAARVRGLYPRVDAVTAHLDGSFGALQPESVIRAIIATLRAGPAQPGSRSARSRRAMESADAARTAVGDLVGAPARDVVLGPNTPALMLRFASLLSRSWTLADEVLLSRADADLTVHAFQRMARTRGAVLRWAEVDLDEGSVPTWQYEQLLTGRTRVVTLTLANPALGTVPDVRAIAELAHQHGALVVVDAGAALPHAALDLAELGADLLIISAATFGGPTVAAAVAAPGVLSEPDGDSSLPLPERFEFGPLPVELLDGLTAAVDHLAGLEEWATGSRRDRIAASLDSAGDYQQLLYQRMDDGLRSLGRLTVLGGTGDRLPMVAFTVVGNTPAQVAEFLGYRGVSVWSGPSGFEQLLAAYGADELGGAVFAGVMPHNTSAEVDHLLDALSLLT